MKITEVLEKIQNYKIVPVASLKNLDEVQQVTNHLVKTNLPIIEITFRTGNAGEFINMLKNKILI
jgi:2-keto-3-deoxy-6-phosphogluconate aldolase